VVECIDLEALDTSTLPGSRTLEIDLDESGGRVLLEVV
jgi:hypothetical protein